MTSPRHTGTQIARHRRAVRSVLRPVSRLAARRDRQRKVVLMYHAIGYSRYGVHPEDFAQQMEFVSRNAQVVSLTSMISGDYHNIGAPFICAITFDDGYSGIFEYAYPVLRHHGLAAILYVTTSAIDVGSAKLAKEIPGFYPGEPVLNWKQVEQMSKDGITIGSHLCNHCDMRTLSRAACLDELGRSKEIISQRLGVPCDHFAYPSGLFNDQSVLCLKSLGYRSAVTVSHTVVPNSIDPFRVPRMGVAPENSTDFQAMLRGDLDYLWLLRKLWGTLRIPV